MAGAGLIRREGRGGGPSAPSGPSALDRPSAPGGPPVPSAPSAPGLPSRRRVAASRPPLGRLIRALAVLLPVTIAAVPSAGAGLFEPPPRLAGTTIDPAWRAPDFSLTDQDGRTFHLADQKGTVVVLTFIYTHCTDVCPFVALKVKSAIGRLGAAANRAVFVAVTTDPERDTQSVTRAYSRAAGLDRSWHFLSGPPAAVRAVLAGYRAGAQVEKTRETAPVRAGEGTDDGALQGLSTDEQRLARGLAGAFGGGYEVTHSTPIWFIDRQGMVRAVMGSDSLPSEIARNVRLLAGR